MDDMVAFFDDPLSFSVQAIDDVGGVIQFFHTIIVRGTMKANRNDLNGKLLQKNQNTRDEDTTGSIE